jgi:hypothetical protein
MTTEWYKAKVNQMKAHIGKQGGLHPARFDYTYKVWYFAQSSLQLYYAKMLSDTPHWVLRYRDLKCFRRHLLMRGYKSQYIGPNKSYVPLPSTSDTHEDEKPFLAVFNVGTPEMDEKMVALILDMNLAESFDLLANVSADPRGNVQQTYGFSPNGFDRHDYNHYITTPQALKGNKDQRVVNKFVAFTKLQAYTMKKYPGVKELIGEPLDPVRDQKRQELFAHNIHPANEKDCLTVGANILKQGKIRPYNLAPGANKKLRTHIDKKNSQNEGYQVQGTCSQRFIAYKDERQLDAVLQNGKTTGENSELRAFNSCFMKQACDDAVERTEWMLPLFSVLDPYYHKLPLYRRSFQGSIHYGAHIARKEAASAVVNTLGRITLIPRCLEKTIILGNINDSKLLLVLVSTDLTGSKHTASPLFTFVPPFLNTPGLK